jgi:hypothetical protein
MAISWVGLNLLYKLSSTQITKLKNQKCCLIEELDMVLEFIKIDTK